VSVRLSVTSQSAGDTTDITADRSRMDRPNFMKDAVHIIL